MAGQGPRLVLLGTGTPNADPDRSGPAVAIIAGGSAYLVDCGPGVVRRAAAAARRGISELEPARLGRVFITHLHSDHTAGLADLILTPWVLGRARPLEVHGPPGTREMVEHLLAAYREDIHLRLDGLEPANEGGWKAIVQEVSAGRCHADSAVQVDAIGVRHGSWKHAFAYRFEAEGRTIVVSGDTAPSPELAAAARGCDVLVHEVYSDAGFRTRPPEWQRYHAAFHTSASELGRLAGEIRPGLLVLYHQLFWGTSEEALVAEVRRAYDGPVVSGKDLDVY
jgi:ribonuclease BN (tRNA processing enzyme)